jgi:hypothetical protein
MEVPTPFAILGIFLGVFIPSIVWLGSTLIVDDLHSKISSLEESIVKKMEEIDSLEENLAASNEKLKNIEDVLKN